MGKKNRRRANADTKPRKQRIRFVARPFEGLPQEAEIVAMREILPAAKLTVRTNEEYGSKEIDLVTLLPEGAAAMVRADDRVMVALQTLAGSGDPSHDVGLALTAALGAHPGAIIPTVDVFAPAPRLQEILDLEFTSELELITDFGFWLDPAAERTPEIEEALEQSRSQMVPCERIPGSEHAFWFRMNRDFVRWVATEDENRLFDALGKLRVAGNCHMGEGSRYIGAFRACGIVVPVFEFEDRTSAGELTGAVNEFATKFAAALADETPLTPEERRARAGLVSRQVSVR